MVRIDDLFFGSRLKTALDMSFYEIRIIASAKMILLPTAYIDVLLNL